MKRDPFNIAQSLWAVKRVMDHAHDYRRAAIEEFRPTPAQLVDELLAGLLAEWGKRGRQSW